MEVRTVKLETDVVRTLAIFEKLTKVHVRDCIITENTVYFLVDPDKVGLAIGKNGSVIKDVIRVLGKSVKVFGYSSDPVEMIKNIVPNAKSIEIKDDTAMITIQNNERTSLIGMNGKNIKVIRQILERHFKIKNIKIR